MVNEQEMEIPKVLDDAVTTVLQALRELESDGDILSNSMEDNIQYIVWRILEEVYGSNRTDAYTAIGVIDTVKALVQLELIIE